MLSALVIESPIDRKRGPRAVHRCALPPHFPKTCSTCKQVKTCAAFYPRAGSASRDGYGGQCKECRIRYSRIYAGKHPDIVKKSQKTYNEKNPWRKAAWRDTNLRRKYGIGVAEYDALFAAQAGTCPICQRVYESGKRMEIDHCHETGRVRGLLCNKCNKGIGLLGDNPEHLAAALRYLVEK